jgi:type II secretory pathway pseudopilin PulG
VKLIGAATARRGRPGFTLPDLVVACSIMATLSMMAIPVFNSAMSNSQLDGAARRLMSDLREARSRAVTTGWRFRIVANDSTVSGTYRNQYRIEGKSAGACDNTGWPAETWGVTSSSTIWVGPWVDLKTQYPDITLAPLGGSGTFSVCFDGKGIATFPGGLSGVQVTSKAGVTRSLQVSTAGSVQIL